jgi:hypothetical protein
MFAKISLTAAFLLLMAPPIACASNRNATNPASSSPASQAGIVVAQDNPAIGTNDNDNNSDSDASDNDNNGDSNDNDDNQNADGTQMNEQNAAGGDADQQAQPNAGDNDQNDSVPQFNQQQPENPNQ